MNWVMKITMNKVESYVPGVGRVVGGGIHCTDVYDPAEVARMQAKGYQIIRAWWIQVNH